jgi:hypothetical protein
VVKSVTGTRGFHVRVQSASDILYDFRVSIQNQADRFPFWWLWTFSNVVESLEKLFPFPSTRWDEALLCYLLVHRQQLFILCRRGNIIVAGMKVPEALIQVSAVKIAPLFAEDKAPTFPFPPPV